MKKTQPRAESYSRHSGVSAEGESTEQVWSANASLEKLITPRGTRDEISVRDVLIGVKRNKKVNALRFEKTKKSLKPIRSFKAQRSEEERI